ncbi:MAG: hypothetical protein OEQ74_10375, partial [Gammaproteobacteria bacterium]|nr:hypothetical protein [Gammaproteobacteria bacterium]
MNDKQTQQLSTPEDYARGIVKLLQGARKTVDVFSPELTPLVFSDGELIEAARAFALRNQHTTMRVLIRDTAPLTRQGHRFKIIAQRISSKVLVRALAT